MYENKNDRHFDNTGNGQNEEDNQNWEETSTQGQTQSDSFDEVNSDSLSNEEEKTEDNLGEHSERNPMENEEYDHSNFQAIPKNNDFSLMNDDGEGDEEIDLDLEDEDLEEEDFKEEDEEENEETDTRVYGDGGSGFRHSSDQNSDGYTNDENKNSNEASNF